MTQVCLELRLYLTDPQKVEAEQLCHLVGAASLAIEAEPETEHRLFPVAHGCKRSQDGFINSFHALEDGEPPTADDGCYSPRASISGATGPADEAHCPSSLFGIPPRSP
jgi:hypothetical protein